MLAANVPASFPLTWAASAGAGYIRSIPTASQISITPGAASLTDGFPPLTFTPVSAGGVPPFGQDMNGILNQLSANAQWANAGGMYAWNSAFSTAIGGYPNGAILASSNHNGCWLNLVDGNTTNPDAVDGSAANWIHVDAYGSVSIALTNANVTLLPAQFGKNIILLTGTLTGNVQLTFPKLINEWLVINQCTGAFAVSALTSGGTPVVLAQGGSVELRGDGTNVNIDALQVAPATQSQHAVQQSQAFCVGQALSTNLSGAGRALNTLYTNSTGKAIIVYVLGTGSATGAALAFNTNGVQSSTSTATGAAGNVGVMGIVPAGQTYQLTTSGTVTLSSWFEYK